MPGTKPELTIGHTYHVRPHGTIAGFVGVLDDHFHGRKKLFDANSVVGQYLFTVDERGGWCLYEGEFDAVPIELFN